MEDLITPINSQVTAMPSLRHGCKTSAATIVQPSVFRQPATIRNHRATIEKQGVQPSATIKVGIRRNCATVPIKDGS